MIILHSTTAFICLNLICTFYSPVVATLKFKSDHHDCSEEERINHPHLCHLLGRVISDPINLANELYHWSKSVGYVIDISSDKLQSIQQKHDATFPALEANVTDVKRKLLRSNNEVTNKAKALPTILAHGMGDSCFNDGMIKFTSYVSSLTSTYASCIPTGSTRNSDTNNGFFLNMDASVDIFASQIQSNPQLKDGFNAIGLSQGNNVIRGYIARYNDPPVHTFLSLNGVNAGTGAVPNCIPKSISTTENKSMSLSNPICNLLMEVASNRAYTTFAQTHSFQANYWRDPRPKKKDAYAKYSQLAQWNNEGRVYNSTLNENYSKTKKFVWVMALQDTMVWPKEGEQWGAPNPLHPFDGEDNILDRKETDWYKKDLFGLRSAEEAGKNNYESFNGPHLGFSMDELDGWVKKYFNS